jgi:hypothetical protein
VHQGDHMIKEGGCGSLGNYSDPATANDTQRCLWTERQQTLEARP